MWLWEGEQVVKVVGSGMCIYTSISRRYPIFSRLSPAHASTSEKNGLVEAGGDLEDWRADHRVLVQQGQAAGGCCILVLADEAGRSTSLHHAGASVPGVGRFEEDAR